MTEDQYLTATIVNDKYEKTIRLVRNKNNCYTAVYPKSTLKNAEICKDIILDVSFSLMFLHYFKVTEEVLNNLNNEVLLPIPQNELNYGNTEYQVFPYKKYMD